MNLHAMANRLIRTVHPNETGLWVRSAGTGNVKGLLIPRWEPGVEVVMQVQSAAPESLAHLGDKLGSVEAVRKAWIKGAPGVHPSGINRPEGRGGDMIRRADGTWWLITEVSEDFTKAGWVSVVMTLQVDPPDLGDPPEPADAGTGTGG